MVILPLQPCPFCGGEANYSGDYVIACKCGASVTHYNYRHDESHITAEKWNKRSMSLEPIIEIAAKLKGQGSAYTDLCSANFKLKTNRS